jgi:uncharacterized protein YdeI (YjbR/CyaY-like superfamily)
MIATFFETELEFREWLAKNHKQESELLVGFYKTKSDKPSMLWSQSVDQALCFGWIDGIRKSIDNESYSIRFTPRKKTSIWSAVNVAKVENLIKQGLMQAKGLEIYQQRTGSNLEGYTSKSEELKLSPDLEKIFRANTVAWDYFQTLAPTYRKPSLTWVMTAKQEATKIKRLNQLIADSEAGTNKWKHNKYTKK